MGMNARRSFRGARQSDAPHKSILKTNRKEGRLPQTVSTSSFFYPFPTAALHNLFYVSYWPSTTDKTIGLSLFTGCWQSPLIIKLTGGRHYGPRLGATTGKDKDCHEGQKRPIFHDWFSSIEVPFIDKTPLADHDHTPTSSACPFRPRHGHVPD